MQVYRKICLKITQKSYVVLCVKKKKLLIKKKKKKKKLKR